MRRQRVSRFRLRASATPLLAAVLVACAPQPEPRTVLDFMDDGYAREGVLTRCNQNRDETLADEECANARRAAAAIALEAERARAGALEQESEAKLLALRESQALRTAAEQDAATTARAAAEAAYEARWSGSPGSRAAAAPSAAPAFGAPVGSVLPSMTDSPLFDVYADGAEPLGRPTLQIDAVEPPPNELVIASPRIEMTDLAVVPRPLRTEAEQ
jgi:hypothetical protein